MTRRPALTTLLVAIALALAACGPGATTTAAPATVAPTVVPAQSPAASEVASAEPSEPPPAATAACEVLEGNAGTVAEIADFSFPAGLSVAAGGAITWTNADSAPHTVTFADGNCDSGSIAGGSAVTVTYLVPGTYPFACRIHPAMQGSLEVEG